MPKRKPSAPIQLKLRMKESLRARLEEAATKRAGSINSEILDRLERSFDRQALLADVLTTAYGSKEVAGVLMLLGEAMQNAGYYCRTAGRSHRETLAESAGAWLSDPQAYDQAVQATHGVLEALRPRREDILANIKVKPMQDVDWQAASRVLDDLAALLRSRRTDQPREVIYPYPTVGADIAHDLLAAVRTEWSGSPLSDGLMDIGKQVRALLGPVATRLRDEPPLPEEQAARRRRISEVRALLGRVEQQALTSVASPKESAGAKGRNRKESTS